MRARIGLIALMMTYMSIANANASDDSNDSKVEAILQTPEYRNAHWGLLVVDRKTGKPVYEKNADQLFCPASVTKLFSTAAAMADLGADYRFQTPVVRKGDVDKEGVLKGDLILVAQGDLSLGGRTGPDGTLLFENDDHTYSGGNNRSVLVAADPLAGLDHLAREIQAAGIKEVHGDVIVDDRLFVDAESSGSGPSRVSPILVNDNVIDVVTSPAAKAGEPATIKLVPATSFVSFESRVETVAADAATSIVVKSVGHRRFTITGKIALGHKPVVKIHEVEEPASFARALFIEVLRKRGVRVETSALAENPIDRLPSREEVKALPKVAEYISPKLPEYLKVILKVSHNLHASTLPLLIAAHHSETTLAAGLKREGAVLKSLGVEPSMVSFGGGAGGSRADMVTPRATVSLLLHMAGRPDFLDYESALPVLGRDGTLAKAVPPESPARGHARAKTGTYWVDNGLNGKVVMTSKALAGYMETATGRQLVFAFFLNNVPIDAEGLTISEATAAAGRTLGKLCEAFYNDGPTPEAKPATE